MAAPCFNFHWMTSTVILLIWANVQICGSLQCMNENGENVDWFFIYKVNDGLAYSYYDDTYTAKQLLVVKGKQLSDTDTALARTLTPIWQHPEAYNYIAYNDEPPNDSNGENYGHTKGVFGYDADSEQGFFLIHSWPKFPSFYGSAYNIGEASTEYAQSFLCISYSSYSVMNSIANQIRYNQPDVYNSTNLFTQTNNFTLILGHKWLANTSIYSFESSNRKQLFTHFAKSKKWDNALYEYLVSPHYQQDFMWETWRRSPEQPTFCQPQYAWNEENVEAVKLGDGTSWKYTDDHAKLGCSTMPNLVCVGDINRMYSQYTRGGGTCCFQHNDLYSAFAAAFQDHDECNQTTH